MSGQEVSVSKADEEKLFAQRAEALARSQAEADAAAAKNATGTAVATVEEKPPELSAAEADMGLKVIGAWLLPADGIFAAFTDEERAELAPHFAALWNKWLPYIDFKWKTEAAFLAALLAVFGTRVQLMKLRAAAEAEKNKQAEAAARRAATPVTATSSTIERVARVVRKPPSPAPIIMEEEQPV